MLSDTLFNLSVATLAIGPKQPHALFKCTRQLCVSSYFQFRARAPTPMRQHWSNVARMLPKSVQLESIPGQIRPKLVDFGLKSVELGQT